MPPVLDWAPGVVRTVSTMPTPPSIPTIRRKAAIPSLHAETSRSSTLNLRPLATRTDFQQLSKSAAPAFTATVTGELCVQHSPTTGVVPVIMAVGITGGIVIGNKQ